MELKIMDESQLAAGDVLLCYSTELAGKNSHVQNGYSHAAIVTSQHGIVEANSSGVSSVNISDLFEEYGHIAVLRNLEIWSQERLKKLDSFVKRKLGTAFNRTGMYKLPERKEQLESDAMDRVHGYFEDTYRPSSHDKGVYFCSELITASFIETGIIGESASILLSPETFTPEDIGRDKVFGFFVGYIKPYDEYEIPDGDNFRTSI